MIREKEKDSSVPDDGLCDARDRERLCESQIEVMPTEVATTPNSVIISRVVRKPSHLEMKRFELRMRAQRLQLALSKAAKR